MQSPASTHLRRYRLAMGFFLVGLVVSGITAFPLLHEVEALVAARGLAGSAATSALTGLDRWLIVVRDGLRDSHARYPWLAYGTDWLAFAHVVIAIFFIGPMMDPVRNVWVVHAGIVACVLVIPLALICGEVRQVPFGWRLIDCSFGVIGVVPLVYCLRLTRKLTAIGAGN